MSALDLVRAGEKAATIKAQQSAIASREAILRQEEAQYELNRRLYEILNRTTVNAKNGVCTQHTNAKWH